MKKNLKAIAIAMLACAAFVACSDDDAAADDDVIVTPDAGGDDDSDADTDTTTTLPSGSDLVGDIDSDVILEENGVYTLTGKVHVNDGATLYIKPGVVITSDFEHDGESSMVASSDVRYILVKQGGKIDAQGTAENPIIMTSVSEVAGAWGGLHICGYAPVNTGSTNLSEIGNFPYGGDDAADNSGVVKYVVLKYTGQSINESQECNGISFYGVGNGTEVSHVSALDGTDDGFEFFGGTVDIKYALVRDCQDDSFDWTDGWCGRGQFLVAYQTKDNNDCLMECDTNGDNNAADLASKPVLSNVTLVGVDHATSSSKTTGVMLKAGTQIELYNAIITGKTNAITIKTTETNTALLEGPSALSSVFAFTEVTVNNQYDAEAGYSDADFTADGNVIGTALELTSGYVGTVSDVTAISMSDSFFETADFVGAVESSNDWTVALQ